MRAELILVVSLVPSVALAHPNYPTVVKDSLRLSAAPTCSICHRTAIGQKGNATRSFVDSLFLFGMSTGEDATALARALRELRTCEVDTDADGVDDVEELRQGSDLNDGPGPLASPCFEPEPEPEPEPDGGAGGGGSVSEPTPKPVPPRNPAAEEAERRKNLPRPQTGCAFGRAGRAHAAWLFVPSLAILLLRRRRSRPNT